MSEEADTSIPWTVIVAIIVTCVVLAIIGIYLWYQRFKRNRRKNIVIPKRIVFLRTRPSAEYGQIAKFAQLNSYEEVPATTRENPKQAFESFVTINPDDSRVQTTHPLNTLLEDDEYDTGKQLLIPSYKSNLQSSATTFFSQAEQLTSKNSQVNRYRQQINGQAGNKFEQRNEVDWKISDELDDLI